MSKVEGKTWCLSAPDRARYWGGLNRFRDHNYEQAESLQPAGGCMVEALVFVVLFSVLLCVGALLVCRSGPSFGVALLVLFVVLCWFGVTVTVLQGAAKSDAKHQREVGAFRTRMAQSQPRWEDALVAFAQRSETSAYRGRQTTQVAPGNAQYHYATSSESSDGSQTHLAPVLEFLKRHWPDFAPRSLLSQLAITRPEWRAGLSARYASYPFLFAVVDAHTLRTPAVVVLVAAPIDPAATSAAPEDTAPGRSLGEEGFVVGWNSAGAYAFFGLETASNETKLPLHPKGPETVERIVNQVVELAQLGSPGVKSPDPVVPDELASETGEHILRLLRARDHVGVIAQVAPNVFKGLFEPRIQDLGILVQEDYRPVEWHLKNEVGPCLVYRVDVASGSTYTFEIETLDVGDTRYVCHLLVRDKFTEVFELGWSHLPD